MRRVFLDTVGLLAIWNIRDQWHIPATRVLLELDQQHAELWSTDLILVECANVMARFPFRQNVQELRLRMKDERRLVEPTPQEYEAAWSAFAQGRPGDAGLVDQVSILVMRRLEITDVFGNDKHFRAAGMRTLF